MKLSTVILPCARWRDAKAAWVRAEALGLHAAYTYDHLSWRSFREKTWFTMVPTLAAAAEATTSIRLGPLVTSPNFRHPLVLAKDLLALDDISNGRVIVGVGSGGTGFDASTLGHEPWNAGERHRRFVEFTRALDVLLRETTSTLEGIYYPVVDSRQWPGPVQLPRPPIFVSALGPQSMALAAEMADGWVVIAHPATERAGSTRDEMVRQVAAIDEALDQRGRDPRSLERVLLHLNGDERPLASLESFVDWAGRYHELGFTEVVVHWPVADSPFDCDVATFEEIATSGREAVADFDD